MTLTLGNDNILLFDLLYELKYFFMRIQLHDIVDKIIDTYRILNSEIKIVGHHMLLLL
jgi:hypothetical protein